MMANKFVIFGAVLIMAPLSACVSIPEYATVCDDEKSDNCVTTGEVVIK